MMRNGYFDDGDGVRVRTTLNLYNEMPPIEVGERGVVVGTSYGGNPCVPFAYTVRFACGEVWVYAGEIELCSDGETEDTVVIPVPSTR